MKKKIIFGSIFAILIIFLMVSNATAVQYTNGEILEQKLDQKEEFFLENVKSFLLEKNIDFNTLVDNIIIEIIGVLAALLGFVVGIVTWIPFVAYVWGEYLKDVILTIVFIIIGFPFVLKEFISEGFSFISAFGKTIDYMINELIIPMLAEIGDNLQVSITYPFGIAALFYLFVTIFLYEVFPSTLI